MNPDPNPNPCKDYPDETMEMSPRIYLLVDLESLH